MTEELFTWAGAAVMALIASGGFWQFLQARQSKKMGVREQDISQKRDSAELALDLATKLSEDRNEMQERLDRLEAENRVIAARLTQFQTSLEEIAHKISELVDWEANGYPPPPPHSLTSILAQLMRLVNPKE